MGFLHLTITVLQQQAHGTMQHTGPAFSDGGGVAGRVHTVTSGFYTNKTNGGVLHKGMEQPHGIRSPAHTGHQHIWQAAKGFLTLLFRFLPDDRVKIAHQHWIGVRTSHRTQDVVGGFHVRHPVANRFTGGVFQCG